MLASLICLAALAIQQPQPRIVIENGSESARRELVRVSVPWPEGRHRAIEALQVGEDLAPCIVLERWPDGSIALVQAAAWVTAAAEGATVLPVEAVEASDEEGGPWPLDGALELQVELRDPWGRRYVATLVEDHERAQEEWARSARTRVRRLTAAPRREGEQGPETLLRVRAWLTEFAGSRRAELSLLLANDPAEGEPVLGPVRFSSFALLSPQTALQVRPRFRDANLLQPPLALAGGGWRQLLLGPSDQIYLGDRSGKAFRFDLFLDGEEVSDAERQAARLAVEQPLSAWPELDWVRFSAAFGAGGGPAPVPEGHSGRGTAMVQDWRARAELDGGPFGGFGDPRESAVQGTQRNGASALHNALRWRSAELLRLAEVAALQQCLRPTSGTWPRLPADMAPWRAGLGERAIGSPHGWTALDYEHFSVDLLHDWYWLSGDPLARAELARAGEGLRRLLPALPFRTSRGEGWCLQAGVLIARATGDRELLESLALRVREELIPGFGPAWAVSQPPHEDALGREDPFESPWQMAALVRGLCLLWRATGDEPLRDAALRVARAMVTAGWVDEVGPKAFFSTRDTTVFALAVGHDPKVGTGWMLIDALVLAGEAAVEEADRNLFLQRAEILVGDQREPRRGGALANPWFQLWFDRHPPSR